MKFDLPPLPYKAKDLEPYLSKKAVDLHYNGHQKAYVEKLNSLPEVADMDPTSLETVILRGKHEHKRAPVNVLPSKPQPSVMFNMAAQVYNHTFFFRSLKPKGGGEPTGDVAKIIDNQYGSFENFCKKLRARAKSLFGSGWIWITLDEENDLRILQGLNAETPFVYGAIPLLTIDVWEHAYYLDYEIDRAKYVKVLIENLLNWDFANENLKNIET